MENNTAEQPVVTREAKTSKLLVNAAIRHARLRFGSWLLLTWPRENDG
jgi:hypothetical protein